MQLCYVSIGININYAIVLLENAINCKKSSTNNYIYADRRMHVVIYYREELESKEASRLCSQWVKLLEKTKSLS